MKKAMTILLTFIMVLQLIPIPAYTVSLDGCMKQLFVPSAKDILSTVDS